jgi:hypothetical protein
MFGENYLVTRFVICTCWPDIISAIKSAGGGGLMRKVVCMTQKISAYRILVGKPGAKRRREKSRLDDGIIFNAS